MLQGNFGVRAWGGLSHCVPACFGLSQVLGRLLSATVSMPDCGLDEHTFWLCFCFQVNADKASASAALLDAETELERIHRDVVEVQTKKTLVANSALVSAASAVLEEQLASARGQQQVLQVRQRGG